MTPVGIGTAAGLLLALASGRLIATVLFEVRPTDPLVFGGVPLGLALAGLLAAAVPARRAARIEPAAHSEPSDGTALLLRSERLPPSAGQA